MGAESTGGLVRGAPIVRNDGVTIAKELELKDPVGCHGSKGITHGNEG